jgi:hypothetical protein
MKTTCFVLSIALAVCVGLLCGRVLWSPRVHAETATPWDPNPKIQSLTLLDRNGHTIATFAGLDGHAQLILQSSNEGAPTKLTLLPDLVQITGPDKDPMVTLNSKGLDVTGPIDSLRLQQSIQGPELHISAKYGTATLSSQHLTFMDANGTLKGFPQK